MNNLCLIIGASKTGKSAYNFLLRKGYMPIFYDDKDFKNEEEIINLMDLFDFVIASPGVRDEHYLIKLAKRKDVPVLSSTEVYYTLRELKNDYIIGITGTNGKTTVTSMIGNILGEEAFVCGNIGTPWLERSGLEKYSVIELSSFELARTRVFCPHIFILLNLAPDHIDYHGSYENYINAKLKPLDNFRDENILIYSGEDEFLDNKFTNSKFNKYYFAFKKKQGNGIYVDDNGDIIFIENGIKQQVFNIRDVSYFGEHNLLNILASTLTGLILNKKPREILYSLNSYSYEPCRLHEVKTFLPFRIINDSKATNLAATKAALSAFSEKVVLIAGGKGKQESYKELFKFGNKLKKVVLYGEAAEEIMGALKTCGYTSSIIIKDFSLATREALRQTNPGEVLLLSPACASYDQFKSYEERGRRFEEVVREFEKERTNLK